MTNYGRCFVVVILLQFYPTLVSGNEFHLVPSVSIQQEYNSNIFLSRDPIYVTGHRLGDFITTLSPGIEIVDRTERLDTDLVARLDRLEYVQNPDLSATNQTYSGKLSYLVTPLLSIAAEASYLRNSNPALDIGPGFNIPPGTIIPVIPPPNPSEGSGQGAGEGTGGGGGGGGHLVNYPPMPFPIPFVSIPWNHITSSLSANYQFTEKTTGAVSYNYIKDYYDDPRYQPGTSHNVSAGLSYDFGQYFPNMKGRVNTGYSYYSFPDSRNDSVVATVGFSQALNELWSINVDGGVRRTWSEVFLTNLEPFDPSHVISVREQINNRGWSPTAAVSLNYRGEYMSGELTFSRDLTAGSGLNGVTERNALELSAQYRLSYELSALLAGGYYTYKADPSNFSAHIADQQTSAVSTGVRYEFSKFPMKIFDREKDVAVEASYGYNRMNDAVQNINADRHSISVRLSMQHSFLE